MDAKSLVDLKEKSLKKLEDYVDGLIAQNDKRASVLSFWLSDYTSMLTNEANFDPKKLINYKRGQIVKVHLGYNIGSEEGGLHYCVVIGNNGTLSSPVLTVVPLTSIKNPNKKIHYTSVDIGSVLFVTLSQKEQKSNQQAADLESAIREKLAPLEIRLSEMMQMDKSLLDHDELREMHKEVENCKEILKALSKEKENLKRLRKEIGKMRQGSIALVGQITTVSKLRIYDPMSNRSPLYNVKLGDSCMDKIDKKIKELFTKQ